MSESFVCTGETTSCLQLLNGIQLAELRFSACENTNNINISKGVIQKGKNKNKNNNNNNLFNPVRIISLMIFADSIIWL